MAATVSIGSAGARDAATQRAGAYRYIKRGLDVGDDLPEVLSVRPGITGFWQARRGRVRVCLAEAQNDC